MKTVISRTRNSQLVGHGILTAVICLCTGGLRDLAFGGDQLTVHEWGTFTSFQNENGVAFSGINTDDEPVPAFVHRLFYRGEFAPTNMPPREAKGVKYALPSITMRLETPVTYFYLPADVKEMSVDVSAEFRGGWLTEFFPQAAAEVDGRTVVDFKKEELTQKTVSKLTWNGITLSESGQGPKTDDRVWLAPREVRAAQINIGGESERFLFYRGVAHLDALFRIARPKGSDQLEFHSQFLNPPELNGLTITRLWLAEITADGNAAFRALSEMTLSDQPDELLLETSAKFSDGEFSSENLGKLRSEMKLALIEQGLFEDEAAALLNTWELSYFRSPGLRLFFVVPQTWTDRTLPLKLSVPANVTRTMVGRIELVTPRHRQLIKKLAGQPLADLRPVTAAINKLRTSSAASDREKYNALASGRGNPKDLGTEVPECYQTFLDLGRFRSSLLLNAAWGSGRSVRGLSSFAIEVENPGIGYQKSIRDQRERDEAARRHLRVVERQIAAFEKREQSLPASENAILFLGGDTIQRWDLAKSFPGHPVTRYNDSQFLLSDLETVAGRVVVPKRPKLIVVQTGNEDIARNATPEECLASYQAFTATIRKALPDTRIVFISLLPSLPSWRDFEIQTEVNDMIREFSNTDDRLIFVDLVPRMLNSNRMPRPELFRDDQSSDLSEPGYELLTRGVAPYIGKKQSRSPAAR